VTKKKSALKPMMPDGRGLFAKFVAVGFELLSGRRNLVIFCLKNHTDLREFICFFLSPGGSMFWNFYFAIITILLIK
jgi:hypothetical protein